MKRLNLVPHAPGLNRPTSPGVVIATDPSAPYHLMTIPMSPMVAMGLHQMIVAIAPVHRGVIHAPGDSGDRDVEIIVIMREVLDELFFPWRRLVYGRHVLMMIVPPWPNLPIVDLFRHVTLIAERGGVLVAEIMCDPKHVAAMRVQNFAIGLREAFQGVVKGGVSFQLRWDLRMPGWKGR